MDLSLNKIGLVFSTFPSYLSPLTDYGVTIIEGMRKVTKAETAIRKIHLSLTSFGLNIWLSNNLKKVKDCDTIIVFANKYNLLIFNKLIRKYPNKRYIFWYWNPVNKCVDPSLVSVNKQVDICTFDKKDAEKYHLRFVETFSVTPLPIVMNSPKKSYKYDIYFIGQNKGRLPIIIEYIKDFKRLGLSYLIQVVDDSSTKANGFKFSDKVPYSKVLEYISNSKCILDIIQNGQEGLTQRVFEAIAMNKKLITNNLSLANTKLREDNRVFLLGVDKIEDLISFINTELPPLNEEITSFYSLTGWLNRLLD